MAVPLKFSEFCYRRKHWIQPKLDTKKMWDAISPATITGGTKNYTKGVRLALLAPSVLGIGQKSFFFAQKQL